MAQPANLAASPTVEPTAQTPEQPPEALDQMVAPIALYPDSLIAQILAAAIYPTEIVEADRWMQQEAALDEAAFGEAVNQQAWDPSVKALTEFPSILSNMDQNLSWTSALGEAYASQPQAVFDAIQVMRGRAEQAGTLNSTPQETVTTEGQMIVIQPANPDFVYVPEYDPWFGYGMPIDAYPNWDPYPGLFLDGPGDWFDLGVGIGVFGGFAWGWNHWRPDWHGGRMIYNHNPYISHRPPFPGASDRYSGHGGFVPAGGFHGAAPIGRPGAGFTAVSGFGHNDVARSHSSTGMTGGGGGHR